MPLPRLTSIRVRLTLWYSAVTCALVVCFAVGSFMIIRVVLARRADRFLQDVLVTFFDEVQKERSSNTTLVDVVREELAGYRFREIAFYVLQNGRVIARSPQRPALVRDAEGEEIAFDESALLRSMATERIDTVFSLDDSEGGFRVAVAHLSEPPGQLTIAAVQSWHGYDETLETIALAYVVIVPLMLAVAGAGGYWLATRSLAPVTAIGNKAATIGRENLSERLFAPNPHDELGHLASVFNEMLARLEASFEQQQQFIQDASHELRSPVTAIRMEADVALRQEHRTESEYRDAIATIRRSTARLSKIVDDLFFLARQDAERPLADETIVDLGEVVYEAVRSLRPVAAAHEIQMQLLEPPEAPVRGASSEIVRVVVNIVENALKYAPIKSRVLVSVEEIEGNSYAVRVQDEGPGIPRASQERIFDRFFRDVSAPSEPLQVSPAGAGLGLPIARALATKLGGRLELESSGPSGSVFAFTLPKAA